MSKRVRKRRDAKKAMHSLAPTENDALEVVANGAGEIVCGAIVFTARLRPCGKLEGDTCWELQIFDGLHPAADLDLRQPIKTVDVADDDLRTKKTGRELLQFILAKTLDELPENEET